MKKTSQHKGETITTGIHYITKDKSYIIHGFRSKGATDSGAAANLERGRVGEEETGRLDDEEENDIITGFW